MVMGRSQMVKQVEGQLRGDQTQFRVRSTYT